MKFKEFGDRNNPAIILIHGGGLSCWSVEPVALILKEKYHVITPIIDGHGEDGDNDFISIRNSSKNLIEYIDRYHSGNVHALCGLSIGGQIVVDALSRRDDICRYSLIESALNIPMRRTSLSMLLPMIKLSYPLAKKRWYSKLQGKNLLIPKELYEQYYIDSCRISRQSLCNIIYSNSTFSPDKSLKSSKAKALIIYGTGELGIMKKSALLLEKLIPDSRILPLDKYGHGELSQLHPDEYGRILIDFIEDRYR